MARKSGSDDECLAMKGYMCENIVVTHVENPEKFYCRFASDENKFKEMDALIWARVRSPFVSIPDVKYFSKDSQLLSYSSMHKNWCRTQVNSIDDNNGIISAKVCLVDYGSNEIIAWNEMRKSDEQIINFNDRQSFCFECSLCYIKPYNEENVWSSYANYLFENLTKDKVISLNSLHVKDGVVICDLSSVGSLLEKSFVSLIDYLVQTRVARYKMGEYFYNFNKEDIDDNNDNNNLENGEQFEEELNIIEYDSEKHLFYH